MLVPASHTPSFVTIWTSYPGGGSACRRRFRWHLHTTWGKSNWSGELQRISRNNNTVTMQTPFLCDGGIHVLCRLQDYLVKFALLMYNITVYSTITLIISFMCDCYNT